MACSPFRIATASEDNDSGFYAGPPFKLSHKNSVSCPFLSFFLSLSLSLSLSLPF